MNGKERVRNAIAHKPVDKMPLGFYAVDHDTIEKVIGRPTYVRNRIATQVAFWEGRRDEVVETWKKDLVEFYQRIDCADVITERDAQIMPPKNSKIVPPRKIGEDRWEDARGRIWQAVPQVDEIRLIVDPTIKTEYQIDDFKGPIEVKPPDPSCFEVLDYIIAQFGKEKFIVGPSAGFNPLKLLGGFENGLMMHIEHPEIVSAALARDLQIQNQSDHHYLNRGFDAAAINQDMGGTNAPFVSPKTFREICFPYMQKRISNIKKWIPITIMHNCGHTIPLMEMFIEAGVNCYQSLQTTAGMEIGLLKERFGKRMCFWGGMPVEVLVGGTVAETRKCVRDALEKMGREGGFIFGPSQSIMTGTKYNNFMAMIDEFAALRDKF